MFTDPEIQQLVATARKEGIEPASLFAIVEVESSGNPFEADGHTPRFLFERHIFYRELKAKNPAQLQTAVDAGLAFKSRQSGQYSDEGTSAGRMALLAAARAIDHECANRACSWGIGQILGANAESLGYASATSMVEILSGGIIPQVDSMIRFIKKNNLVGCLNLHNWAAFALHYNGASYATNRYDVKMAAAYSKWAAKLDSMVVAPPPPAQDDPQNTDNTTATSSDEMPPPYIEPKTVMGSKTVWSSIGQVISVAGVSIGSFLSDWRVIAAFSGIIVFLALFIGRERILKILEDHS